MVSVNPVTTTGVYSNQLNKTETDKTKSLNQVASGKSVNKASDNASGLAIASQLLSDVSTLKQSSTNLLQGSSLLQATDGSLEQSGNILNRMKELSTQAQSGSLDDTSRASINDEYQNLKGELDKLSDSTSFNNQKLTNGTYNNDFQAGTSSDDVINVDLTNVDSSAAGLGLTAAAGASTSALLTPTSAQSTSDELDTAINTLSSYRAEVGALKSEVSTRNEVVDDAANNNTAAQSAIVDSDLGKAMADFQTSNIMNDVALAAAAQGNKMSTSMLKLVR